MFSALNIEFEADDEKDFIVPASFVVEFVKLDIFGIRGPLSKYVFSFKHFAFVSSTQLFKIDAYLFAKCK